MLKIYILSAIIWFIIYYATIKSLSKFNPKRAKLFIREEKLSKKDKKKNRREAKKYMFYLCLIPILRFIILLGIIYMFFLL